MPASGDHLLARLQPQTDAANPSSISAMPPSDAAAAAAAPEPQALQRTALTCGSLLSCALRLLGGIAQRNSVVNAVKGANRWAAVSQRARCNSSILLQASASQESSKHAPAATSGVAFSTRASGAAARGVRAVGRRGRRAGAHPRLRQQSLEGASAPDEESYFSSRRAWTGESCVAFVHGASLI